VGGSPTSQGHLHGRRAIFISNLSYLTAVIAVVAALLGWRVRFWQRSMGNWHARWLDSLNITPLRFDSDVNASISAPVYDLPAAALHTVVGRQTRDLHIGTLHLAVDDLAYVISAIKVGLLQEGAQVFDQIRAVATWQLSEPGLHLIYVARRRWETLILDEIGISGLHVRLPAFRSGLFRRFWRLRPLHRANSAKQPATRVQTPLPDYSEHQQTLTRVIMVFNLDDRFSNLYEYSNFYSKQEASPLHPNNMAFMSRYGGHLSSGRLAAPWPQPRTTAWHLTRSLRRAAIIKHKSPECGWFLSWRTAWALERSAQCARELELTYPRASVACFAYDLRVPTYLSLAFFLAGIRTVAYQERIDASLGGHSPHTVDTLLAASEYFGRRAQRNYASAIRTVVPVGMWRTDLIYEARQAHQEVRHGTKRSKLVLVLPYRVDSRQNPPGDTLAMSVVALQAFLNDILALAEGWPSYQFVIRAKTSDWTSLPEFRELMSTIAERANVRVDDNYEVLNETYRLAAEASLVVANFSSIVDEVLALGIPCFVRDFTPQSSNLRDGIFDYLPPSIVCRSTSEFFDQLNRCLSDGGAEYQETFLKDAKVLYGELNDGYVRVRGTNEVLDFLHD
jgi:hypothetical protein